MNFRIDLNLIAFRLVGDRLPRTSSAVLCHFVFDRTDVDDLMHRSLPLVLFDPAIDLRRLSLTYNEIGVELEIG